MNIDVVYQEMEDPKGYILKTALPILLVGIMIPILFPILFPKVATGIIQYVLYTIPFYALIVAVLYPVIEAEKEKNEVEDQLPLFVARMALLSTSGRGVKDIFRLLGDLPEYGRLS
jgi:archaellum biogenesis protein FlaJ (TadC family)